MRTLRVFIMLVLFCLFTVSTINALECPKCPEQNKTDWDVQIQAAVGKIGPVKGGELSTRTQSVTKDLMRQLPNADRIYLETMMYCSYCSALRDDKSISGSEKARRLKLYNDELRKTLFGKPEPGPGSSNPSIPKSIDPAKARFGVTLGWQLARYEFAYDSPFPEARAASPSIEKDIQKLLEQDGFSRPITGLSAIDLIHDILLYYSSKDLEKHASILLGIAALRASLVGASKDSVNNEEMQRLSKSAIQDIDKSVIKDKDKLFRKLISQKPTNVTDTLKLLDK